MQTTELRNMWRQRFGDSEPVAHLLRDLFADRWVRFHSLPEAKRYPESEAEMTIVLERHNRVISRLVADDRSITLLSTEYSESAAPTKSELAEHDFCNGEVPWRSVAMHELADDWGKPTYWHVFSSDVPWSFGSLDGVLRLVAVDKVTNVMLISRQGWLYHPYDGGADVILPTPVARHLLANEFSPWLSRSPVGL